METPDFILYLGLRADADERAIRKAYARQLKEIDQETQVDAFQMLRQAYNAALYWAAAKLHSNAPHDSKSDSEKGFSETVEQPPIANLPTEENTQAQPANEGHSHPATQQELVHQSEQKARSALDAVGEQLRTHALDSNDEAHKLLSQALETPSLMDMDARFLFEWGIASWLANGWQPGHQYLFPTAMDIFKWRQERARLYGFGQAGYVVDLAIAELEMYDAQPWEVRPAQRDLIRQLRDGQHPGNRHLVKNMPTVEHLAALYPHWLHMITNTSNIVQWRTWHSQAPAWVRWTTRKPGTKVIRTDTQPDPQKRFLWTAGFFIAVTVLLNLGSSRPPQSPTIAPKPSMLLGKTDVPSHVRSPDVLAGLSETFDPSKQQKFAANQGLPSNTEKNYGAAIRNAILPNIVLIGSVQGNPIAEVTLHLAQDGRITSRELSKPSGAASWDYAVLRAIDRTVRLPADSQGRVPPTVIISFSPKA
jgi:protein TonB